MKDTICLREAPLGRKNYNGIDLAKFVCSLLVIAVHVKPFGSFADDTVKLLNFGVQNWLARIAVPFFFVCSGYFLYKKTTLRDFSVEPSRKTLLHLLKLYLIWTLLYLPLSVRAFLRDPKGLRHAVLTYCRNCFITGSYTHLWYFPALIFAVFLTSYLLSKHIRHKHIVFLSVAAYGIGLLAQSWFGLIRPLQSAAPPVWQLLKLLQKLIVTTRDGLFDGFLFVNIGAVFAFYEVRITRRRALTGFLVSMVMLLAEAASLKALGFARAQDLYLSLIPAAFFGFAFIRQAELPDHPVFPKLRKLSSLLFYSHLWIEALVRKALRLMNVPLAKTAWLFLLTVFFSILASLAMVKLAEKKRFQWLRLLYS